MRDAAAAHQFFLNLWMLNQKEHCPCERVRSRLLSCKSVERRAIRITFLLEKPIKYLLTGTSCIRRQSTRPKSTVSWSLGGSGRSVQNELEKHKHANTHTPHLHSSTNETIEPTRSMCSFSSLPFKSMQSCVNCKYSKVNVRDLRFLPTRQFASTLCRFAQDSTESVATQAAEDTETTRAGRRSMCW